MKNQIKLTTQNKTNTNNNFFQTNNKNNSKNHNYDKLLKQNIFLKNKIKDLQYQIKQQLTNYMTTHSPSKRNHKYLQFFNQYTQTQLQNYQEIQEISTIEKRQDFEASPDSNFHQDNITLLKNIDQQQRKTITFNGSPVQFQKFQNEYFFQSQKPQQTQIRNNNKIKIQTDSNIIKNNIENNNNNEQNQFLNSQIISLKEQLKNKTKQSQSFSNTIHQKNILINHLTQQLRNIGNKLDHQRSQFTKVQQHLIRLKSIYRQDSQIKKDNIDDLQTIQRNQQLLQKQIQNTRKTNKHYLKDINKLKDQIDNLNLALQWSQQENYKFRLTIRQLKQKSNQFQIGKVYTATKSCTGNTKSQHKSSQESFNFGVIQLSSTKIPVHRSETEIVKKMPFDFQNKIQCQSCKAFGLKIYQIVSLLPLNESQERAMFEPESNEDIITILHIIHRFCKQYQKNMKKLERQRKQTQNQAVSFIKKLISQNESQSTIKKIFQNQQIKQNTFSQRISYRLKQMEKNNN